MFFLINGEYLLPFTSLLELKCEGIENVHIWSAEDDIGCCYSVTQSCPTLRPHGLQHARIPCPLLSLTLLKLMSTESIMPPSHFILCCPLLLLPSIFPSIRVFSSELAFCIRWPKYWSISFSISPSKMWSTGEGNGKPLQHSCLLNTMNNMKRQKDIWYRSPRVICSLVSLLRDPLLYSTGLICVQSHLQKRRGENLWVHFISSGIQYFEGVW